MAILQEIKVPLLSVNDTSITVLEMNFKNGDPVKKGSVVLIFETSKTTYELASESDGFVQYRCVAGEDYEVNETVAAIFSDVTEAILEQPSVQSKQQTAPKKMRELETVWEGETIFSPEANRLIESSRIDKSVFSGKDFVSKFDVEELLGISKKEKNIATSAPTKTQNKTQVAVDHTKVIVEKLTSAKKREIEYLKEIQSAGLTSTIDMVIETEGIFFSLNKSLRYLKNSLLPVIIYEGGRLLKKYDLLNAYFTGEGVAKYRNVNIGFAADIGKGLKVLKIANTADKTIHEIETDIMELSNRYLDDILQIDDLTDITFTITDLSAEGASSFRPLVNMMNSGILGISSVDEKLQRCTLNLTFDHRVTEGKLVTQFLKELKERVESYKASNPMSTVEINCYKCMKSVKDDLSDVGFMKCMTTSGTEGYICQSCLNGF